MVGAHFLCMAIIVEQSDTRYQRSRHINQIQIHAKDMSIPDSIFKKKVC